jgi:hypothetical protein
MTNDPTKYLLATNTVARPVPVQSTPISVLGTGTGTVGHSGVVEYSKSSAAVVRETYVVATKK